MGTRWEREGSGEEQGPNHPCAEQRAAPNSFPARRGIPGTRTSAVPWPGKSRGSTSGGGTAPAHGTKHLGSSQAAPALWKRTLQKQTAATRG